MNIYELFVRFTPDATMNKEFLETLIETIKELEIQYIEECWVCNPAKIALIHYEHLLRCKKCGHYYFQGWCGEDLDEYIKDLLSIEGVETVQFTPKK
jgi:hypothetical protein